MKTQTNEASRKEFSIANCLRGTALGLSLTGLLLAGNDFLAIKYNHYLLNRAYDLKQDRDYERAIPGVQLLFLGVPFAFLGGFLKAKEERGRSLRYE